MLMYMYKYLLREWCSITCGLCSITSQPLFPLGGGGGLRVLIARFSQPEVLL